MEHSLSTPKARLLLAEDDRRLAQQSKAYLTGQGYLFAPDPWQ
ncbi:hypothetical protein PVT67_16750 [Gallaecimonas kandeliae]|nr:hypothetical protein [Gallaecimonas kandeliae]WKE65292.1 hypothetical protein PVT67_16750 [Gallaecimonas kandeliae]